MLVAPHWLCIAQITFFVTKNIIPTFIFLFKTLALCVTALMYLFARDRKSVPMNQHVMALLFRIIKTEIDINRETMLKDYEDKVWDLLLQWKQATEERKQSQNIDFLLKKENLTVTAFAYFLFSSGE